MSDIKKAVVREAVSALEDILRFGDRLRAQAMDSNTGGRSPIIPSMHQVIRIYQALEHSAQDHPDAPPRRIVLADGTSSGKTYTAVAIKALLDAAKGRRHKTLVVAPSQVIQSAWLPSEVNHYCKSLNLPERFSTQDVRELDWATRDQCLEADVVLINYVKFQTSGNERNHDYVGFLVDNMDRFDMIVLDEFHNLKNVAGERAQGFRRLAQVAKRKPMVLTSASPMHNKLKDLGMLLYLLDPDRYERYATQAFEYRKDPSAIQNAIVNYPWFYFERSEVAKVFNLPPLLFDGIQRSVLVGKDAVRDVLVTPVILDQDTCDAYLDIWRQGAMAGHKIMPMRRVLLEAKVDPLVDRIERIIRSEPDASISVFSSLKEGFITPARDALAHRGILSNQITGDEPDISERVRIARRFGSGEFPVLFNTNQTVGEGIPMITGDRPCYVILAEPPIGPGEYDQLIGRHYRNGQRAPVTVMEMIGCSPDLNAIMEDEKRVWEAQGIKFRAGWKAGTLDEDRLAIRLAKEYLFDRIVRRGLALTDVWEVIADIGEAESEADSSAFTSIPRKKEPSNKSFMELINKVAGCIGRSVEFLNGSEGMDSLVSGYSTDHWDTTSSADTNRLTSQIIAVLEDRDKDVLSAQNRSRYDRVLDWGSGPACLERALKRPVVSLDYNLRMLEEAARRVHGEPYVAEPGHGLVRSNMCMAPFKDESFDIVHTNYALQYNAQGFQHRRDIENIIAETNRVLSSGGYAIFGLPNQATSVDDIEALTGKLLPAYGFSVVFNEFVKGYASTDGGSKEVFQGAYIVVAKKSGRALTTQGLSDQGRPVLEPGLDDVMVYSPYKTVGVGGVSTFPMHADKETKRAKEKLAATEFRTQDGRGISEVLGSQSQAAYEKKSDQGP